VVFLFAEQENIPGQGVISLLWALALVKCAAVWMPMLTHIQASHTGVLKNHVREVTPCSGKGPFSVSKKWGEKVLTIGRRRKAPPCLTSWGWFLMVAEKDLQSMGF
jgi:hypothetical protein